MPLPLPCSKGTPAVVPSGKRLPKPRYWAAPKPARNGSVYAGGVNGQGGKLYPRIGYGLPPCIAGVKGAAQAPYFVPTGTKRPRQGRTRVSTRISAQFTDVNWFD